MACAPEWRLPMARGLNGSANGSGGHVPTARQAVEARLPGRSSLPAGVAVFACGLFAKQSMVTLPLLLVGFDWLWLRSREACVSAFSRIWPHVFFFALVAGYLALRHTLFGNAVRESLLTLETLKESIDKAA